MADIDMGSSVINRNTNFSNGNTILCLENPANESGKIDTVEIWSNVDLSGCKVGTFFIDSIFRVMRDFDTIGNVTSGSKQTFSGLNIDVEAGDTIGIFFSGGSIERDTSGGSGLEFSSGDRFTGSIFGVTNVAGDSISLSASGETVTGTNMKINIGDSFKDVDALKINIGDVWKDVVAVKQNIDDVWKDVF